MTARKNPDMTEQERDHAYYMREKRGKGDTVTGDLAENIQDRGPAAQVEREREAWAENKERQSKQDSPTDNA